MNEHFITKETITAIGINLEGQDIDSLLAHLDDTLEERIGTEITEELSDEQLNNLLKLKETANDQEVGLWLEKNVPNMKQIAQDEIDILLGELAENSEAINSSAV